MRHLVSPASFDQLPLSDLLPIFGARGIGNASLHSLLSRKVPPGSVVMPGVRLLILQIKTDLLVAAGLDVRHVRLPEDQKGVPLLGIEREYGLPNISCSRVQNLFVTANLECVIHVWFAAASESGDQNQ